VGVRILIFLPEFLIILVRSPCKNLKPYDIPFWDFNNGGNKKKRKISKVCSAGARTSLGPIVATFVSASSQEQRTHSAQTKIPKIVAKGSAKGSARTALGPIIFQFSSDSGLAYKFLNFGKYLAKGSTFCWKP
jgi:hypothetical protein